MTAFTRLSIGDQHTRVAVVGGPAPATDLVLGIGDMAVGQLSFENVDVPINPCAEAFVARTATVLHGIANRDYRRPDVL